MSANDAPLPTVQLSEEILVENEGANHAVSLIFTHKQGVIARTLQRGQSISVGRDPVADIVVDSATLSRTHARFELNADGLIWVEDLKSTNGTFIDGARIHRALFFPGNELKMGDVSVAIDTESPAQTTAVVASASMIALFRSLEPIANAAISVMIIGETGVGKEIVARSIHERSPRKKGPFLALNCGAIPEHLIESVLFGHERGAFTGADKRQAGIFESAHGGTVFLDEIGELPLQAQVSLLRVLETKTITRVGSTTDIPIDVRIVAATHRDLEMLSKQGSFRSDLFYRLNGVTLRVPALRDRHEDIEHLARHFMIQANRINHRRIQSIAPDAMEKLIAWRWPGNVRELRNVIERAVVVASGPELSVGDLPDPIRVNAEKHQDRDSSRREDVARHVRPTIGVDATLHLSATHAPCFKERVDQHEKQLIVRALSACGGNPTQTAEALGIAKHQLVFRLRKHGIKLDTSSVGEERVPESETTLRFDLNEELTVFETRLLSEALNETGGNLTHAARSLKIPERTMRFKMAKLGITRK